jgi:prepilin-type N-terminal cleavage/methylation domain-containing protein
VRRNRAFTLIETIVAIVVLGVALPPMLLALREAQRRSTGPVQADRARWLAAERLEEIIADRHSSVLGWAYVEEANYPAESPVEAFPGFQRTVSVAETGPTLSGAGTGFKVVTVTVAWTDAGGGGTASRSVAVSTVLTDYTP